MTEGFRRGEICSEDAVTSFYYVEVSMTIKEEDLVRSKWTVSF